MQITGIAFLVLLIVGIIVFISIKYPIVWSTLWNIVCAVVATAIIYALGCLIFLLLIFWAGNALLSVVTKLMAIFYGLQRLYYGTFCDFFK